MASRDGVVIVPSGRVSRRAPIVHVALAGFLAFPGAAEAYVGPGAGFALIGSFFVVVWAFLLALFTLATLPFRMVVLAWRRRRLGSTARRRVVVLGFDGMDPRLVERWMQEGILPNFRRLAEKGSFRRLGTTHPPLSPVAWSSFMTGVHPARHGIFDFLARDVRTYLPYLSSSSIRPARRHLAIGKFMLPLGRPRIESRRRAPAFWKILGSHGVFSTVVRVPATFPAEPFPGLCLCGMSVPDVRGTQGSFTLLGENEGEGEVEGGVRVRLSRRGSRLEGAIPGPEHPRRPGLTLEAKVVVETGNGAILLRIGGRRVALTPGRHSEWVPIEFGAGVRGIARFRIVRDTPPVAIYVTPVHLDPARPALPISHPRTYASYLARLQGSFATLGLAEDTWAVNEGILDEEGFLEQTYLIQEERERQLDDALERTRTGLVACVFDATDRIQHLFYRYVDDDPRAETPGDRVRFSRAIEEVYRSADRILGRVMERLDEEATLFVLSDHGFTSFRRGVNLNAWLRSEGWLTLIAGRDGSGEFLGDVDWERTRAYAIGLGGIYLNLRGRESRGIVAPGEEAELLIREIASKLERLPDPESGAPVVRSAARVDSLFRGPYLDHAPDLMVGYQEGYRVSWEAAVGRVAGEIVVDNRKAWSGDHCVDPELVPGILLANRRFAAERPSIVDLAPTILGLYGIEPPAHMEGRSIRIQGEEG